MSTTLDAGEDRLIVDAFDRACAAYPRAYGGDAPAEPPAAALAMPPAEGFVPPAGAATPVGLPTPPLGDTYGDLLRSWYYAGYYSGLHEARQRAAAARAD